MGANPRGTEQWHWDTPAGWQEYSGQWQRPLMFPIELTSLERLSGVRRDDVLREQLNWALRDMDVDAEGKLSMYCSQEPT